MSVCVWLVGMSTLLEYSSARARAHAFGGRAQQLQDCGQRVCKKSRSARLDDPVKKIDDTAVDPSQIRGICKTATQTTQSHAISPSFMQSV